MIRLLVLIAAVSIGLQLDPSGLPLERVAWLGAFGVAFASFVSLFAPKKDVDA